MTLDDTRRQSVVRIYLTSGVIWQLSVQAYWLLLFVRVVVDLDFDPLQLVLLGTAKEVAVLASEIPTGVVADVVSRKWSVVTAFVVAGLAVIGAGAFDEFGYLLISSALWGFGQTFRSGAETAWLTDELGSAADAESVVIGRTRLELVAVVVGTFAAIGLAALTSLGQALIAFGSLSVLAGLGLAIGMPEHGFVRETTSRTTRFTRLLAEGWRTVRHTSALRVLFFATVFAGFASEAVDRLGVRRLTDLGLSEVVDQEVAVVGGALVIQSVVAVALMSVLVKRLNGPTLVTALTILMGLTALGVAMMASIELLWVGVFGLILQGTMRSIAAPVTIAWANAHANPESRATVHSFIGQAQSLGEISGGVVLGLTAARLGLPIALGASATIYAAGALVAGRAGRSWSPRG